MNRRDVKAARDLAAAFVKVSDELLAAKFSSWSPDKQEYVKSEWRDTAYVAGKQTGAHRRLSLDLTRALAHMRRRL